MACKHIAWVEASEDLSTGEKHFENTARLQRVVQDLPDPTQQKPRLVHFIGTKNKDRALRYIFPNNNFGRKYDKGNTNLRVDVTSSNSSYPLLIADSNPFRGFSIKDSQSMCHHGISHPITWSLDSKEVTDVLFCKLIFPMSDLVCVFADDFTNLESVAARILSWMSVEGSSQRVKIQLLIITSEAGPLNSLQDEDFRLMLHSRGNNPRDNFTMLKIFRLAGDYLSPLARYQRLKDAVYQYTWMGLAGRKEKGHDLSALHLNAIFDTAVSQIAKSRIWLFDFISVYQHRWSILDDIEHLRTFLKLAEVFKPPVDRIALFIASCILVDAYPPRMHSFLPQRVFQYRYRHKIVEVLTENSTPGYAEHIVSLTENHLLVLHQQMQLGKPALDIHRGNMKQQAHFFAHYRTNMSCLFCLGRSSERHLSCGHSICDMCIRRFGKGVIGREDRYSVSCIFDNGESIVDLKPKTAGVRIISLDGGGTRGLAPLTFLDMLESMIPGCPLHEQIDYAAGSSSGGLIILGMFFKQWDSQNCKQMFLTMAKRCFGERSKSYGHLLSLIRWLISDGLYDDSVLKSLLQEKFPDKLFGYLPNIVSGTRLALTAASKSNTRWIFANYNATGQKPRNEYDLVRADNVDHEVHAWEAGRATSAAPVFFKPIEIDSSPFWDGGIVFPDPVKLALFESERLWPESIQDAVISMGTGIQPRGKNGHRSLSRLWMGFMDMLDGHSHSRDTGKMLEKHESFFRLNTKLRQPMRLDNIQDLEELGRTIYTSPKSRVDTRNVALALLLSNFYLIVDESPSYKSGLYIYKASIHCRAACKAVITALKQLLDSPLKFVTETEVLGECSLSDICDECLLYHKKVTITTRHPSDSVTIYIHAENKYKRKISGFPQKMSWFEKQQNINDVFGTQDHDVPGGLKCSSCTLQYHSIPQKRSLPAGSVAQRGKRSRI